MCVCVHVCECLHSGALYIQIVQTKHLLQNVDFNIFEGLECHGVPVVVISQGRVVVDHGKVSEFMQISASV